jgi:hypothetical protein
VEEILRLLYEQKLADEKVPNPDLSALISYANRLHTRVQFRSKGFILTPDWLKRLLDLNVFGSSVEESDLRDQLRFTVPQRERNRKASKK